MSDNRNRMARPVELARSSRFIVLASVCVVIAALYFGREVLIPLSLAVLLSFLLSPPVRWLERVGLRRVASSIVVVLVAVGAIGVVGYVVYEQSLSVLNELPKYRGEFESKIHAIRKHSRIFGNIETGAKQIAATTQPTPDNPLPVRNFPAFGPLQTLRDWAGTVLGPLATAGLVLVFVLFMLFNREDLRDRMIRLVGHGRLNLTTQALDEAGTRISKYLGALAIVNSLYGAVVAGGLWVIGYFLGGHQFPNVLVWGLLVGLFRFVPYVGVWIGAAFPLLLSFALFPGSAAFFATLGLFVALEIVVAQFIEPLWYGASTGMSPLAVLVAAVFWTWLWGPVGLLLSTPLTVCLVVIGKHVPQLQFLDIMLGDEPVLPPHARVYQRLIALDEEEASEVVNEFKGQHSLEEAYDQVLMPALAMAEQDHHRGKLDEDRHRFVRSAMRDLVEELADAERAHAVRAAAEATVQVAKNEKPDDDDSRHRRPSLPANRSVNVLCLPAKDEADEIVGLMLTQLLDLRGYQAMTPSVTALASEMLDLIEQRKADIVALSALPPSAVAHARYLCKRITARFPDMNTVVGLWLAKGDLKRAGHRIACAETVPLVTTLAQAQDQIDQMAHIVHAAANAPEKEVAAARR